MIRILLVDDQELVRAVLRGILRPLGSGSKSRASCSDGRGVSSRRWASLKPDIVLMDVRMPTRRRRRRRLARCAAATAARRCWP